MTTDAKPILIVDDDAFQRRMIRIKLQTRGYEVNEAKDGIEALGFLAERGYSLVLLDIVMPQLNGWEVLDQIRALRPQSELPVVMMTAEDNTYDADAATARGADDYLTKPIDFMKLNERLDVYVNGGTAEATSDQSGTAAADPVGQAAIDQDCGHDHSGHNDTDTGRHLCAKPIHSLLDGLIGNLPGVFFRAIGNADHNVQLSFESEGLKSFLGQEWDCVQDIFASLEKHDRREVNRQFREHAIEVRPILLRFPCRNKIGRVGWIECRATPHKLPSGETVWDAMLLDVTEQKELELAAIRSREAAERNPAPEFLPLLEMYRRFHAAMRAGENTATLAANIAELERELSQPKTESAPVENIDDLPDRAYRDESGFIHQCAQCRKVKNFADDGTWELIADWTHEMPLKTNHTICDHCAEADELLTTE